MKIRLDAKELVKAMTPRQLSHAWRKLHCSENPDAYEVAKIISAEYTKRCKVKLTVWNPTAKQFEALNTETNRFEVFEVDEF